MPAIDRMILQSLGSLFMFHAEVVGYFDCTTPIDSVPHPIRDTSSHGRRCAERAMNQAEVIDPEIPRNSRFQIGQFPRKGQGEVTSLDWIECSVP
jgi:hypothetical protein